MSDQRLFTHDTFPLLDPAVPRFMPGTRLRTPDGPCEIERLALGDLLETRDGPRRIVGLEAVQRGRPDWSYDRGSWPVRIPVGSLGNAQPMRASPEQRVLLSGATVRRVCGVHEISVRLRDLVGLRGLIVERPLGDLRYIGLTFGTPAVIHAEDVPCEVDAPEAAETPREKVRETFRAMHAVGEPPLVRGGLMGPPGMIRAVRPDQAAARDVPS